MKVVLVLAILIFLAGTMGDYAPRRTTKAAKTPSPSPPPNLQDLCACRNDNDCVDSSCGSQCVKVEDLPLPTTGTNIRLCAKCNPMNDAGCDENSSAPFCAIGFGYVECTCLIDSDCSQDEKCGVPRPSCVADIMQYCSKNHDADYGCEIPST